MWTDIRELHWDSETKSSRREMRRGKKNPRNYLTRLGFFRQLVSLEYIYRQIFFFIKRPSDNNKKNMDQLHFYAPVQQISLPFLVDTFQGSNKTRDGLDTDKSPSYRCGY